MARVGGAAALDTIALVGTQEYYVGKAVQAFSPIPLGEATLTTAGRRVIYTARNRDGTVAAFDTAGTRIGGFAVKLPRRRVSASEWAAATRLRIKAEPLLETQKAIARVLREIEPAAQFPMFDQIRADWADNLWIRTFDNFESDVATWLIVDSRGRPLAAAATPRQLDILEIGEGYVLGVERNADDVERVMLREFSWRRR
jgi:hypothetical protein